MARSFLHEMRQKWEIYVFLDFFVLRSSFLCKQKSTSADVWAVRGNQEGFQVIVTRALCMWENNLPLGTQMQWRESECILHSSDKTGDGGLSARHLKAFILTLKFIWYIVDKVTWLCW